MPLPNYGYFNKEEKKHQELLFEMAPEIVESDDRGDSFNPNPYAKKSSNLHTRRAKVTTGMFEWSWKATGKISDLRLALEVQLSQ